jgi:hypothetical protein
MLSAKYSGESASADVAVAAPGSGSLHRDRPVDPDAVSVLLGAGVSRRVGRARHGDHRPYISWNGFRLISAATRLQGIFFWDFFIYLIEGCC